MKIAILGCGNLGMALAEGLLSSGFTSPAELYLTRRSTHHLDSFEKRGVVVSHDNAFAVKHAQLIILALKPYNVEPILDEISPLLDEKVHCLVSVATGLTLKELTGSLNADVPVFRAMPNTAAGIGESITAISSSGLHSAWEEKVQSVFNSIGASVIVQESLMEAATILGACGIAYVMRFIRAMVQGGIQIGFDAETASLIVNQAVRGASGLLIQNKTHPESEIDKVTTPKGCTIVGLNEMEHNGFSSSLIRGIVKSYEKIET